MELSRKEKNLVVRYYLEKLDKKIHKVILQDETGVYSSDTAGQMILRDGVRLVWANLPEWAFPREVLTTSMEYLDFVRRFERNSYMATRPTKIREEEGTLQEVLEKILVRGR